MNLAIKTTGEPLKDEFGLNAKFKPVKRPCVSRLLLLDVPETLLVNFERYSC